MWDLQVRSGTSRVLPQCLALGFLLLPRVVCSLAALASTAGFTVTSRFRGIALLIRRTAGRSGYTCLALSLSHGSVLVELEAALYSDAGEACTIIDTSREPLPVCVALPRFRFRKPEWLLFPLQLRTALGVTDKLCTCRRSLLSDIVQLTSSKVWRFKFATACSPHTGNCSF